MTISTLPEEPGTCIYRRVFHGHADQIGEVRQFLRTHLGGHPSAPDVTLVASELTTNAWEHTNTGKPGGTFTVEARQRADNTIRLEVHDDGGPTGFGETNIHKEGGRGLGIVAALTVTWGVNGDAVGRTVWAEFKP
ncbi:ATP-binding protein [Actinoallomurus sp. CA-150999]|uniref:ATP-binding protein n=1 Tax=Actinoallomurus sp. CA-150999 TaxID=3239887 RepID=UPI003D8ACEE0